MRFVRLLLMICDIHRPTVSQQQRVRPVQDRLVAVGAQRLSSLDSDFCNRPAQIRYKLIVDRHTKPGMSSPSFLCFLSVSWLLNTSNFTETGARYAILDSRLFVLFTYCLLSNNLVISFYPTHYHCHSFCMGSSTKNRC